MISLLLICNTYTKVLFQAHILFMVHRVCGDALTESRQHSETTALEGLITVHDVTLQ